jgi:polyisoprenoid-binding protein YceI
VNLRPLFGLQKEENPMPSLFPRIRPFPLCSLLVALLIPAFAGATGKTPAASTAKKAAALSLKNPSGTGDVNFLAVGKPSMLKIHGTATGPAAVLTLENGQLKGNISIELEKLDTGISLRTRHMKEKYLQAKDYPKAVLSLLDAAADPGFEKSLSNGGEKSFRGKLALHGKEKEISGSFSVKDGLVKAKFPIVLSDFAIDVPKYLGITVADNVEVDVELQLRKE